MSVSKKPRDAMPDIELMERFDSARKSDDVSDNDYNEDQRRKLQGLSDLSEIVRGHLELDAEHSADLNADKMWAAIDNAITTAPIEKSAIVVEDRSGQTAHRLLGASRKDGVPQDAEHQRAPGVWGWMAMHRAHFVTAALSAGVVAGIALWTRTNDAASNHRTVAVQSVAVPHTVPLPSPIGSGAAPAAMVRVVNPTDIESLDVPDGTGTVMTITDDDGDTAVIWISPNDVEGL